MTVPQSLEEIVKRARELKKAGFSTTEISEELKLDGETVLWLLMGRERPVPADVFVDMGNIAKSPERISMLGAMLASLVEESGTEVEVVVATGISSIVLGFAVAAELGVNFCYAKLVGDDVRLNVDECMLEGKEVVVLQDVIAGGALVSAAVNKLREVGANVRLVVTFLNKRGLEEVSGVKVISLVEMRSLSYGDRL